MGARATWFDLGDDMQARHIHCPECDATLEDLDPNFEIRPLENDLPAYVDTRVIEAHCRNHHTLFIRWNRTPPKLEVLVGGIGHEALQ